MWEWLEPSLAHHILPQVRGTFHDNALMQTATVRPQSEAGDGASGEVTTGERKKVKQARARKAAAEIISGWTFTPNTNSMPEEPRLGSGLRWPTRQPRSRC
eukprot:5010814-Pyramimonas_sp.AAC.1